MTLGRLIHTLSDLLTGTAATNHVPLYHATGGWKTVAANEVDARSWGVTADGTTDDTTALQTFASYVVANNKFGRLPPGTIKITDKISIPRTANWGFGGRGRGVTTISQATNNTPIWYLGSNTASFMHTWRLEDMSLTYANSQAAANTNANPIAFAQMGYEFALRNIGFDRGSYGIRVVAAVDSPWGGTWDDLVFGSGLTVGAVDIGTLGSSAAPNNHWGRWFVDCQNMVGPVIYANGYNWSVDAIEFVSANSGPQLFNITAGSLVEIGSMKLEIGTYATSTSMFNFPTGSFARIGHISVGGSTLAVTGGSDVYIVKSGAGGDAGRTEIGYLKADATAIAGALYALGGNRASGIKVGHAIFTGGVKFLNNGSDSTATNTILESNAKGTVSADKGDAAYTVALGDPNIIMYQTALTASRIVALPVDGDNMHGGLTYTVITNGAVNGANTLVIKASATTLLTETNDKRAITFTWRRHATPASGWVMTGYDTLP